MKMLSWQAAGIVTSFHHQNQKYWDEIYKPNSQQYKAWSFWKDVKSLAWLLNNGYKALFLLEQILLNGWTTGLVLQWEQSLSIAVDSTLGEVG